MWVAAGHNEVCLFWTYREYCTVVSTLKWTATRYGDNKTVTSDKGSGVIDINRIVRFHLESRNIEARCKY